MPARRGARVAVALALLAAATGLDIARDIRPDRSSLSLLPARLVHDYQVVPIASPDETAPEEPAEQPAAPGPKEVLHLASAWPPNQGILDWVRTFTPRPLRWHLALPDRVHQLIIEHYGVGSGTSCNSVAQCGKDTGTPCNNPDLGQPLGPYCALWDGAAIICSMARIS